MFSVIVHCINISFAKNVRHVPTRWETEALMIRKRLELIINQAKHINNKSTDIRLQECWFHHFLITYIAYHFGKPPQGVLPYYFSVFTLCNTPKAILLSSLISSKFSMTIRVNGCFLTYWLLKIHTTFWAGIHKRADKSSKLNYRAFEVAVRSFPLPFPSFSCITTLRVTLRMKNESLTRVISPSNIIVIKAQSESNCFTTWQLASNREYKILFSIRVQRFGKLAYFA